MLAFVNVSSPAASALTQILQEQAATVRAAAAVAVSAGVAASAAASAVGGAAGGGAGPAALMGAQRQSIYSSIGGAAKSCDAPGAGGNGGGWTMGRLGVGGDNPCKGGRRLAKKGGRDGEVEEEEGLVQQLLVQAMIDTIVSVLIIIGVASGIHLIILITYKFYWNNAYYAWVQRANIRTIKIRKPAGDRLGIGLTGDTIGDVDAASPCAGLLFPGDKLHLINGRPVLLGGWRLRMLLRFLISLPALYRGEDVVAKRTSRRLQEASVLFILVSTPQSRLKAGMKNIRRMSAFVLATTTSKSDNTTQPANLLWMHKSAETAPHKSRISPDEDPPKAEKNATEETDDDSTHSSSFVKSAISPIRNHRQSPLRTVWTTPAKAGEFQKALAAPKVSSDGKQPPENLLWITRTVLRLLLVLTRVAPGSRGTRQRKVQAASTHLHSLTASRGRGLHGPHLRKLTSLKKPRLPCRQRLMTRLLS